jgi:hypothetical protein
MRSSKVFSIGLSTSDPAVAEMSSDLLALRAMVRDLHKAEDDFQKVVEAPGDDPIHNAREALKPLHAARSALRAAMGDIPL